MARMVVWHRLGGDTPRHVGRYFRVVARTLPGAAVGGARSLRSDGCNNLPAGPSAGCGPASWSSLLDLLAVVYVTGVCHRARRHPVDIEQHTSKRPIGSSDTAGAAAQFAHRRVERQNR